MALVRLVLQYLVEILVFPVTVFQCIGIWDPLYKKFFPNLMYRFTIDINKKMAKIKKELFDKLPEFASSSGLTVLELGCGSGANFQFFPWGSKVICVDVNPNFKSFLKQSAAENKHIRMEKFIQASGEDMGLVASGSIDVVVCTLVLCSVQNIDLVLEEVIRVLKPGGAFFFIEHVVAEKTKWRHFFQHVFQPAWRYFGDGCLLTSETWTNLEKAKFSKLNMKHICEPLGFNLIYNHVVGYGVK
ncbi:N6-adenosine-methyltransferase TMT1A-like [Hypanus sabinus]|uniref:N6-adenosine-methyltransferase TMT1A-like n=1 Tax=Hypanus sabinus TaxID=79690 RepID=UPI0028C49522|nr:N6-adenosine-methyltransferase TMT1A-like [Hypanus sabinus]